MHSADKKVVDKLVMMANQIIRNTTIQGEEEAVAIAADHMHKFWEPRMRVRIRRHLEQGAAGLTPLAKRAVERLVQMDKTATAS